jgi:hypothetical protein
MSMCSHEGQNETNKNISLSTATTLNDNDEFMTETHGAVAVLIMDVLVTNWNGPTRTLFVVAVLGKIDTG